MHAMTSNKVEKLVNKRVNDAITENTRVFENSRYFSERAVLRCPPR